MSDLILRTTTRTQVAATSFSTALAAYARRATERLGREQTGQDLVEYAGVILIVSVIIAAVVGSGLASTISGGISKLVSDVLAGNSGKGG